MVDDTASLVPQKSAHDVLLSLYRLRKAQLGRTLSANEFYPVATADIVTSVLNWTLTEEQFPPDALSRATCDFTRKTITVSALVMSPGERNFTIAHEIAHVVMHATAEGCSEAAFRIPARRRIEVYNSDAKALKRERDAEVFAASLLMPKKAVADHFSALFQRPRLWSGSPGITTFYKPTWKHRKTNPGVVEVAKGLVSYRPDNTKLSLVDFFGVSPNAMAIRLVELALVY